MLGTTFGSPLEWPSQDLIGYTDEFEAALALEAYCCGVFPMPLGGREMGWWSPMMRGLLPVDGLHITRSLRKSAKRYRTTVDTAFPRVVAACADPKRPDGWIDARIRAAYQRLHAEGWAHSVETWDEEGRLVGGLYGVHVAGLFAGESMFHRVTDASKAALVHLVELADGLVDVQWRTDHLATLGVTEVPRSTYLDLLATALDRPLPPAFDGTGPHDIPTAP